MQQCMSTMSLSVYHLNVCVKLSPILQLNSTCKELMVVHPVVMKKYMGSDNVKVIHNHRVRLLEGIDVEERHSRL